MNSMMLRAASSPRAVGYLLAGLVVVAAAVVVDLILIRGHGPWILVTLAALFLGLAGALLVVTLRGQPGGVRRWFLLMTAAGALAFPLGIALHNGVYALAMVAFGRDFWERVGRPDGEPVFFVLAVFVAPLVFAGGLVGTLCCYVAPLLRW